MDKFGRNYELVVDTGVGGQLTITPPFTLEFDITRNTLTSQNVCQIRVYNLSQKSRNLIRKNVTDYTLFRSVKLRAGYGLNMPEIFKGNISQAWSTREGTNVVTQIECYAGGFAFSNGTVDKAFPAGTPQRTLIQTLAASLPHVTVGTIGDYPGVLSRGNAYSGNTCDILRSLTGGGFFIDNGQAHALGTNEYIIDPSSTAVISSASGLLGTPVLEQSIARFDMIFEPSLNIGRRIQLQSLTEKNYNGFYKVTAVKHRGMISESVAGNAVTTGEFFYTQQLKGVLF